MSAQRPLTEVMSELKRAVMEVGDINQGQLDSLSQNDGILTQSSAPNSLHIKYSTGNSC